MTDRLKRVVTLRLICYYCHEEVIPLPKLGFFRAYNVWQHGTTGWIICPPHQFILREMAIQSYMARRVELGYASPVLNEPFPDKKPDDFVGPGILVDENGMTEKDREIQAGSEEPN